MCPMFQVVVGSEGCRWGWSSRQQPSDKLHTGCSGEDAKRKNETKQMKSTPNQGALGEMTHTSCLKNNVEEIFRHKFIIFSPQFSPISNTHLFKNSLPFGIFHYRWEIQLPTLQRIMSRPQIYFRWNMISSASNHLFACLKDD